MDFLISLLYQKDVNYCLFILVGIFFVFFVKEIDIISEVRSLPVVRTKRFLLDPLVCQGNTYVKKMISIDLPLVKWQWQKTLLIIFNVFMMQMEFLMTTRTSDNFELLYFLA